MKAKGNIKKIRKPVFWDKHEDKVSKELKELVYKQYYSRDTLTVYCDMSMIADEPLMSVACGYVSNVSVIVKHKRLYTTRDVINKNFYGELEAMIFALQNFTKYLRDCKTVKIYTDLIHIEGILNNEIVNSKNPAIEKVRKNLMHLYKQKKREHPNITIEILPLHPSFKKLNPFHRAAHNAAWKLLRN